VADIWSAISQAMELPQFMDLDDSLLQELYGIDAADLVEYVAKLPLMNTQATEFFVAKVQPGKMDSVKDALAKRQAALEEQWQMYLPAQLELVENYQLSESGDYVIFCVAEKAQDAVAIFTDCTK